MSLNSHVILLPRENENYIAVVRCSCRGSSDNAMEKLVEALSNWVEKTEEGKQEWQRSSYDFNIADLAPIINSPDSDIFESLVPYLTAEGLWNLDIDIYGSEDYPTNYNFDTILVNSPEE